MAYIDLKYNIPNAVQKILRILYLTSVYTSLRHLSRLNNTNTLHKAVSKRGFWFVAQLAKLLEVQSRRTVNVTPALFRFFWLQNTKK